MSERKDLTWIRLQLPQELHQKLKEQAREQRSTLREFLIESIRAGADETKILQSLVSFFEHNAKDVVVSRQGRLISLSWNSQNHQKRIIYDPTTDEIFDDPKLTGSNS